jgi:hypothetical protein
MSSTWRRGTTPVCHPVVLSAFGSSERYEAAIGYTDLRNSYRMAALTAHDQKLLKLHLWNWGCFGPGGVSRRR